MTDSVSDPLRRQGRSPAELARKKTGSVSCEDLAARLGLSRSAVWHALNPKPGVHKISPANAERVRALAAQLHYRPNAGARAIRSRRFHNIGYCASRYQTSFSCGTQYLSGVVQEADHADYRVSIVMSDLDKLDAKDFLPKVFRESSLDGLIIHDFHLLSPALQEAVHHSRLPVVHLNHKDALNSITLDEKAGAKELTQLLLKLGYRRFCYTLVQDDVQHHSVQDRRAGIEEALHEAGLTLQCKNFFHQPWELEALDWIRQPGAPDCIIGYGDGVSQHLLRLFTPPDGIALGSIQLAGFGNESYGTKFPLPYYTVELPTREMGRESVRMLLEIIAHEGEPQPSREYKGEVLVHDWTLAHCTGRPSTEYTAEEYLTARSALRDKTENFHK